MIDMSLYLLGAFHVVVVFFCLRHKFEVFLVESVHLDLVVSFIAVFGLDDGFDLLTYLPYF